MAHHRGLVLAALLGGAVPLALPAGADPPAGRTLGFAIANFDMEMTLANGQACPQGPTLGQMEVFLRNLAGREHQFWSRPENVEQMHFVAGRAPGGEDLCQFPSLSVDP